METPLNIVGANGVYRDTSGEMAQLRAERDAVIREALSIAIGWHASERCRCGGYVCSRCNQAVRERDRFLAEHGRLSKEE